MLHAAIRPMMDDDSAIFADRPPVPSAPLVSPTIYTAARDPYGFRRQPNIPAIMVIILVHALLIGMLIQVRSHGMRVPEEKLTVVNLSPPPPPPPSASAAPLQPSAPEVIVPPPIVQTPVPRPQAVQTFPVPQAVSTPAPTVVAVAGPAAPTSLPPAPPSLIQGGDIGAQMMSGRPPRYPIESRRKREQGTVVLQLILGINGTVETIMVSQSSGFSRLDNAARDAVKHWRWKPMLRDGQPIRVQGLVEIPFVLRPDPD
jgi:protein TonB